MSAETFARAEERATKKQGLPAMMGAGTEWVRVQMNDSNRGDSATRGAYLVLLRQGIRHSAQLGEQLVHHPLIGNEVRALMGRLHAISAELDDLSRVASFLPPAQNDPVWGQLPRSSCGREISLAGKATAPVPATLPSRQTQC